MRLRVCVHVSVLLEPSCPHISGRLISMTPSIIFMARIMYITTTSFLIQIENIVSNCDLIVNYLYSFCQLSVFLLSIICVPSVLHEGGGKPSARVALNEDDIFDDTQKILLAYEDDFIND